MTNKATDKPLTLEQVKAMEEWCDWACGNCSRDHVKWKAARLGYIKGFEAQKGEIETQNKFYGMQLLEKEKEIERLKRVILENSGQFTKQEIENLLK